MTVYILAQLSFTDRSAYERYQNQFWSVLKGSGGRLLAADEHPQVVEGQWPHQKAVLLSFPDAESFRRWYGSSDYQRIAAHRWAGASGPLLVLKGFA